MKKSIILMFNLALAVASATAQTGYQTTVAGQGPDYYNTLDNTLAPTVGSVTFTANNGATFGNDYWGNANNAALFPTAASSASGNDYLTGDSSIISGVGTSTAVGSMSLLFYVPDVIPATGYYFSDGDASSGSYFAFAFGSSVLNLKVANKTFTPTSGGFASGVSVTPDTWYYLALTWDLNGTATGINGVSWYIGQAGQSSLSSGFLQKGGSGNINTTGTLGGGGTMAIDAKTSGASGVQGGEIDELAAWSTVLSSDQISAQFNALAVPEPSAGVLFGMGGLVLLAWRRKFALGRG